MPNTSIEFLGSKFLTFLSNDTASPESFVRYWYDGLQLFNENNLHIQWTNPCTLFLSLSSSLSLSPPYLQYHQTKNAIDFTRTPGDEIAKKSERKLEKQKQIKTSWVVCLCYCLSICILVYFLNNGHSAKILITTVPLIISNERISICYENLLQVTFVKFSQLLKLCVIFKQKFERECRQKRRVITL